MNAELSNNFTCFRVNKLSLNVKMINLILFGNRETDTKKLSVFIDIDGVKIDQVDVTKFFGIYFDEKLSLKCHISQIASKIVKNVDIMNKVRYKLTTDCLVVLCITVVLPRLSCCNIVWRYAKKTNIEYLFRLQERALRITTNSAYCAISDPLFTKLGMLKVL